MSLRKNDEKDPKKKFADQVWNLTQIEAEFETLRSLVVAAQAAAVAAIPEAWPVGSVYTSYVATNPATLLGYGTWTQIEAKFLVGYKSGDADFGTLGATGGAKTHITPVDPPITATSQGDIGDIAQGTGTQICSRETHVHNVDIAAFNTAAVSHLPPFEVVYFWKRIA